MAVSSHEFTWVGAYVAHGCATANYAPLFKVTAWKGVPAFSNSTKEIELDEKYYESCGEGIQ